MDIDQEQMDLESAARLLGVHYQTAYRWVRTGVLPAVKVEQGYRLRHGDVVALAEARRTRQPLSYTGRNRDWDRLREQLHDALVAGDETAARRVFERVRLGRVPLREQCDQLLTPTVERIAGESARGEISAARLRLAVGIAERSLALAVGWVTAGSRGLVLVARPEGDRHPLNGLMAAAVLREGGWAVCRVGAIPDDDVVAVARRTRPALAVVSVGEAAGLEAAGVLQARLQSDSGIPVLVAGPGQELAGLADDTVTIGVRLPLSG
jgi:MerR family transcriptional regulator, light-induced transcriptional regulator